MNVKSNNGLLSPAFLASSNIWGELIRMYDHSTQPIHVHTLHRPEFAVQSLLWCASPQALEKQYTGSISVTLRELEELHMCDTRMSVVAFPTQSTRQYDRCSENRYAENWNSTSL